MNPELAGVEEAEGADPEAPVALDIIEDMAEEEDLDATDEAEETADETDEARAEDCEAAELEADETPLAAAEPERGEEVSVESSLCKYLGNRTRQLTNSRRDSRDVDGGTVLRADAGSVGEGGLEVSRAAGCQKRESAASQSRENADARETK